MNTVLLLLLHILAFSHSAPAPEPDTHLHVHLPPEGGKGGTPNTGGGYANNGLTAGMGRQWNPALYNDYSANLQSNSFDYASDYATRRPLFIDANKKFDGNSPRLCGSSGASYYKDEIIGGRTAELNAFPWMVRIFGGCAERVCGGALITSKHVLTAYHCAVKTGETKPCDHSDEKRIAVLGQNDRSGGDRSKGTKIPIIAVKYPTNAGLKSDTGSVNGHDFAMYILKNRAVLSQTISPICLPPEGKSYAGKKAVAAGWGMFALKNKNVPWTGKQSNLLKRVNLKVSNKKFKHTKMFGTLIEGPENSDKGERQDTCAGDDGGPLMYPVKEGIWVIIGTLWGGGYSCDNDETATFEGEEVGVWNKVSAQTDWILKALNDDEDDDDDDDDDVKTTTPRGSFLTTFKNGNKTLTIRNRTETDYQPSVFGGDQAVAQNLIAQDETAPSDYSTFVNPGPQYGQIYQGAGFYG